MSTEVNVATLKAHLSHYLRLARQGQEIVVKDRSTPIARLVPHGTPPLLDITPARRSPKDLDKLTGIRPRKLRPGDLEKALRWTRQDRS